MTRTAPTRSDETGPDTARSAGRRRPAPTRPVLAAAASVAVVAGTFGLAPAAQAAQTVTPVRGGQIAGWDPAALPGGMPTTGWFREVNAAAPGTGSGVVVADTDEPVGHDGSLRLTTPAVTDAVALGHAAPAGSELTTTGALTYAVRVTTMVSGATTATSTATAVYQLSVDCNGPGVAGGQTVLTSVAPLQTPADGWKTIDAAAGTWWSSRTINSDKTTEPASEAPDTGGMQGGRGAPASLADFRTACPGVVLSYGIGMGTGTTGAVVSVDTVTFGDAVTNFQFIPVDRIAGTDRVATSVAASQAVFGNASGNDGASAVVLASSTVFADGVSGGPLATAVDGPLLLTKASSLDPRVKAELQRVLGTGGTVYLLGGTGALSPAVQTAVEKLGYTVRRIFGADRYGTAVAVARAIGTASTVMLTTGLDYPDALSAASAAAHVGGVVLLTRGTALPSSTRQYLSDHLGTEVYGIGGAAVKAVKSLPFSHQIVGSDRYETSTKTASVFFAHADTVTLASGENFPDALSGGAFAGLVDAPILLVKKSSTPPVVTSWIAPRYKSIDTAVLFGGPAAISDVVRDQLQRIINGGS